MFSGYIEDYNIKPYFEHKEELGTANKTSKFKEAVALIEEYIKKKKVRI